MIIIMWWCDDDDDDDDDLDDDHDDDHDNCKCGATSGFGANMLNAVLDNEWMNCLLQMAACRFHLNFLGG